VTSNFKEGSPEQRNETWRRGRRLFT